VCSGSRAAGAYQISGFEPGELSVDQVAARLGISTYMVHYWIERGYLAARRSATGRLCVWFTPEVEAMARQRVEDSRHLNTGSRRVPAGEAV
jgi:MerR family regulatory protein